MLKIDSQHNSCVKKVHTKPKQYHNHVCKINESSNNQGQLIYRGADKMLIQGISQ